MQRRGASKRPHALYVHGEIVEALRNACNTLWCQMESQDLMRRSL
jgi:hypothetical protein